MLNKSAEFKENLDKESEEDKNSPFYIRKKVEIST